MFHDSFYAHIKCVLQLTSKTASTHLNSSPHVAAILLVGTVVTASDYVISSTDVDLVPIELFRTHVCAS
jgi:hypothetical protein